MKQVLQNARTGEIEVADAPAPGIRPGCVLVRVANSLLSAGTERAAAEFASKNLIAKARSRPDLMRDVVNKVKRDGIVSAFLTVRSRLDQPLSPGYSSAGTVIKAGAGIEDLRPGDRVACAGAGIAVHADFVSVPRLLVARISAPEVDFESAAFTTLGAVALHGVRIAEAKLGEVVAVIGLGLLGQLTVQILRAAGCVVIGIDPVAERVNLAVKLGATTASTSEAEFLDLCLRNSNGYGADAVLITAETSSNGPVNLAARVARDRGIVAAVGAVGMELGRRTYYEKEIDFRVSRSYGPGRYDVTFEQKGRDYPIGYVRWTETRNMEAFLQLLAEKKLDLMPLISHRFPIERATAAYDLITGRTEGSHLGVILQYPAKEQDETACLDLVQRRWDEPSSPTIVRVGVLGAGNFATGTLIPVIRRDHDTELTGICASNGIRAQYAARKFKFDFCTTGEDQIIEDNSINTVVIATRHHLHAEQVIKALAHGKHVFCEKPLCITEDELRDIRDTYSRAGKCRLMLGFNRRFSQFAKRMKDFLSSTGGPYSLVYRVNAGSLPPDHWTNDVEQGGGRIVGEMCHFVDLLSFLCDAQPISVGAQGFSSIGGQDVTATIVFSDGSIGTVIYSCNGDRVFSKERIEVLGSGIVAVLDDFGRLDLIRHGKKTSFRSRWRQDKGHTAEWLAFAECIRSGAPSPIAFEEIIGSTLATLRIAESLRSGCEQKMLSDEYSHSFAAPA